MTTDLEALAREALELADKATEGPWHYSTDSCDCGDYYGCSHADWVHEIFYVLDEPKPEWSEAQKNFRALISGKYSEYVVEEMSCSIEDGDFITKARTLLPQLAQGVLDLSAENWTLGSLVKMKNKELAELHPKVIYNDALQRTKDEEITRLAAQVVSLKREVSSMQGDDPDPWRYPDVEETQ